MYIDKLNDIVNKYNKTYLRTIKMNHIDVTSKTYTDFDVENNDKNPKLKVIDSLRIAKYKKSFANIFQQKNWSADVFVIKKVKNPVPLTYVIEDPNVEKIA